MTETTTSMQRSSWTIGLYMLLVFGSGVLVGGFGHRFYAVRTVNAGSPSQQTPEQVRQNTLRKMQSKLSLTSEQITKLEDILRHTHGEWLAYRDRHHDELKAIQDDQVARVKAILTPAQVVSYQKVLDDQDRERRAREERDRNFK